MNDRAKGADGNRSKDPFPAHFKHCGQRAGGREVEQIECSTSDKDEIYVS
jgi:hypothetical protein